jgi:hypothetical protein
MISGSLFLEETSDEKKKVHLRGKQAMKNMQEHILGMVAEVIEKSGLQPVQKTHWANTGCVYAMDGVHSRCKVTYDFQDRHFSVTISPVEKVESSPPFFRVEGDRAMWSMVEYDKGDRIATFLHELGHAVWRDTSSK